MKRKGMNFTLPESLLDRLKQTSDKTMIPQARLVEKGIEMVLAKVEKQSKVV